MFKYFNKQIKKMNWIDTKIIGLLGVFWGLLLATIFPGLITISFWWYLLVLVIGYVWFFLRLSRKDKCEGKDK